MKRLRNILFAGLVLILATSCFSGCGEKKKDYNIFTEFAVITEDSILPRNVTYSQNIDEFLQERNVTQEDIVSTRDYMVVLEYPAEHIPYEIRESIHYVSDRSETNQGEILMVQYTFSLKASEAEKAFESFYDQAKAVMPEPPTSPLVQSYEHIKEGKRVDWTDESRNVLQFSVAENGLDEDSVVVVITLRCGAYPTYADQQAQ